MDIRYSANPAEFMRYTTDQTRREFLISDLYKADTVVSVYSHVDRMVTLGIMPVNEAVNIDKGVDVWKSFGTRSFLERREAGFFNIGEGEGYVSVDGVEYKLGNKDCIYITKGARKIRFWSNDRENPAKFYGMSAPAHCSFETRLLTLADAAKMPLGSPESSNKRVIYQFIHPAVLPTCQLLMGLTSLDSGSIWNTMPPHTHERRMEIYMYFDLPEGGTVFHFMGQPHETRHLVMREGEAVISPSWSIHSGAGTGSYSFIWAMGGENQAFDDMDVLSATDLR